MTEVFELFGDYVGTSEIPLTRKFMSILAKADKDKRVLSAKYIEHFPCGRRDLYVVTKGYFPIAERDMIVTRFDHFSPEYSYLVAFSTEREDYPINPKYVRADMIGKGIFWGV